MKSFGIHLLFVALVYVTISIFYQALTSTMGDHRYSRMQTVLRGLEQHAFQIKLQNQSYSIDVKYINKILDEKWLSGYYQPSEEVKEYTSDWLLNLIIDESEHISNYWDLPPQITERPGSVTGYGFYLRGPDKVSNTYGEDEDDLNSWDHESRVFHCRKLYRKEQIKTYGITLSMTFIVFIVGKIIYKKRISTISRTEPRVRGPVD